MESQEPIPCSQARRHLSGSWPASFAQLNKISREAFNQPQLEESPDVFDRADQAASEEEGEEEEGDEEDEEGSDTYDEGAELDYYETDDEVDPPTKDPSIARAFMRTRSYLDRPSSTETYDEGVELVEQFCGHVTSEDLQQSTDEKSEPVAFFEEVSREGLFRENRGLMSLGEMHLALQQPVKNQDLFKGPSVSRRN